MRNACFKFVDRMPFACWNKQTTVRKTRLSFFWIPSAVRRKMRHSTSGVATNDDLHWKKSSHEHGRYLSFAICFTSCRKWELKISLEMSEQIGIVRTVYMKLSEVTTLEHLRHSPETFTVKPVERPFSLRNASKLYLMWNSVASCSTEIFHKHFWQLPTMNHL